MQAVCATQLPQASAHGSSSSNRAPALLAAAAPQRRRLAAAAAAAGASPCSWRLSQPQRPQQQRQRGRLVVTAAVKVVKGKQIMCNKTLRAKEGSSDAVAQLCADVAAFSQQRMADRRSGVLAFEVSEDDYEKGTFHFLELYASQTSMADHNAAPEIKQFVEKVGQHLDGPMGMVLYEYTNGKIGPASMEGDVKGEGGLDDATGTNRFGGGASMKQTSAVVDLTKVKEKDDEEKGLWGLKGFTFELPSWAGGKKKEADKK